MIITKQCR